MNTSRITIILSLLFFLGGCTPSNDKVILEKQWLATQAGISHLAKSTYADSLMIPLVTILESLYSTIIIDTFFVDSLDRTRAFEFQITSGYVGIAVIQYDVNKPICIDFYNLFDLSLERYLRPSFSLLFFNDGKSSYIVDGYMMELYQREVPGRIKKTERGLLNQ